MVFENVISLLQGLALGLRNEVESPSKRQEAKDGEKGVAPKSGVIKP
jgi:hypothetical protein